ncbi:Lrp/AsnC family transcriptional regulator [Nonomuraea roseoviolacea]|uniref:Lrp/AsnC family transcriptional regulator n=1 Tax=Nonomuraea roseoviolacea TaxID=103837 RepID=UPI0031CE8166
MTLVSNSDALDAIDRDILFHLRRDGRLSNVDLASRVGLTPPPCLRRVKRLEERGVISGYRAVVDPAALGRKTEVIVSVEVAVTDVTTLRQFEATVASFEEVLEVRRVFGVPDYFLRVAVADADAYSVFQMTRLVTIPGVSRVISHQTMEVIKSES